MPEIIITAVYENGVLRPVTPVQLSEGQTVRIQIVPEVSAEETKNQLNKILPLPSKYGQISPAELARRQQNRKLVKIEGKPLSETIIEDRGPW